MSAKEEHVADDLDIIDYDYPEPTSVQDVFLKTAERIDRYGLLRDDWGGLKVIETDRGNELVPCAGCLLATLRIECGLQPDFEGYGDPEEYEHEAGQFPRNVALFDEAVAILNRHIDLPVPDNGKHLTGYDRVMTWSDSHGLKALDRWTETELTPEQLEEARTEGTWAPVVELLRKLGAEGR